jgi:pimeloyl-ACP methyl ester carboxylesterase
MVILYAHDLDGSPADPLAWLLKAPKTTVVAPDGRFHGLAYRIAGLRAALDQHPGATLVGVGYGALAALVVAAERPAEVHHLVLVGPALSWSEPPLFDASTLRLPRSLAVTLFHGEDDDVVPVSVAREFAGRWPGVRLVVLQDAHDLRSTRSEVAAEIRSASARERASDWPLASALASDDTRQPRSGDAGERAAMKLASRLAREADTASFRAAKVWGDRRVRRKRDPSPVVREPSLPPKVSPPAWSPPKGGSRAPQRMPLVFAHDRDARPGDPPVRLLYRWRPVVPQGGGRTFERRVQDLMAAVDKHLDCVLGGAGDGALVALAVAATRSVAGLLLVGPTLGADSALERSLPVVVVHAAGDPALAASRVFVGRYARAQLVVVDGVADLRDSGPAVVGALQALQVAIRGG